MSATTQQLNSYVDEYTPPSAAQTTTQPAAESQDDSAVSQPQDTSANNSQDNSQDNSTNNPQDDFMADSQDNSDNSQVQEEDLEAQNIFFMLDAEEGSDELKEKFLNQLQEVIWNDFLSSDVQLLITEDESVEFEKLNQVVESSPEGPQKETAKDALIEYLEKLIPDLEDIMLEKALDLKADLFVERISGMKEYFTDNQEKLAIIKKAEAEMFEDNWRTAAQTLNEIQE